MVKLIKTKRIKYVTIQPEPRLLALLQRYAIGSGMSDYYFQWKPI